MALNDIVTRFEFSALFWRDLEEWRNHREYASIRANIAVMAQRAARGEPAGDLGFSVNRLWEGIGHKHVGNKLTLFTTRPEPGVMRFCALKKHDFYGFRSERKSRAADAAAKVLSASSSPARPSPEWGRLKWSDPNEIATHPELRELSAAGLRRLYQEIQEEIETFAKLGAHVSGMTPQMRDAVESVWIDGLDAANQAIEEEILRQSRKLNAWLEPEEVEVWAPPSP